VLQVLIISKVFRKKIGAFSLPSLLFEDLFERLFVTVGVEEESVTAGRGFDMMKGSCKDDVLVGFTCSIFCCILLLWLCAMLLSGPAAN